jgi:hypothetical protein
MSSAAPAANHSPDASLRRRICAAVPEHVPRTTCTHEYKPPQQGLTARTIGLSDTLGTHIHVYGREARFEPSVRIRARYADAQHTAIEGFVAIGYRTPTQPFAPGMSFRGDIPHPAQLGAEASFWNPTIAGPLLLARQFGPYLTDRADDAHVVPGVRVALVTLPGQLEFARPRDGRPSLEILKQAHEELRMQPGSFLSKALVAFGVDADGRPQPGTIEALRTFRSKPPIPEPPGWESRPFQTPKYAISVDELGRTAVLELDGQAATRLGRTAVALQPTRSGQRPLHP